MAPRVIAGARWIGVGVVAVVIGVLVWLALAPDDASDPLADAQALLVVDDGFGTGLDAGETLAQVAQHLERAVHRCRADERGTSCQALAAALGYTQVLAAWVLDCTDPGRHEARTELATYLDHAATVTPDAARLPQPPTLPRCRP